jgi:hypothetical protein
MIDNVGGFLQHNLVVLLAVVLVPMKWVILRLCGDSDAQSTALLTVPEDLCYVALGLVLADMANSGGAFRKYFKGSTHVSIDIFITASINVIVAVLVHVLAKWGNDHFNSFRAASVVRTKHSAYPGPQQIEMPITSIDNSLRTIQLRYMAGFVISYAVQLVLVISWLSWIAKVV